MMLLLEIREKIKEIYYKNKSYADPLWKFVLALTVFIIINGQMGYSARLSSLPVALGLSFLCAFTGGGVFVFLAAVLVVGQIAGNSILLAAVVGVMFIIMYCMVLRLTPNFSYVVILTPILFVLKIPYVLALILGIVGTPMTILPLACGVLTYYTLLAVQTTANATFGVSMEDALNIYKIVVNNIISNREVLIYIMVLAIALLITYVIRRQAFDHAFEIAIAVGTIITILGFMVANLAFGFTGMGKVIGGTLGSAVLALVVWFFKMGLDYTAVERIQFEDDDYYYYVKAVPKLYVTVPEKNVKRMNDPQDDEDYSQTEDLTEDID
ncbi:MAG: hypothetical protein K6G30_07075 [Acetatifactor sp.]|nr:hypothetical protein [Acetatifactor sp.]